MYTYTCTANHLLLLASASLRLIFCQEATHLKRILSHTVTVMPYVPLQCYNCEPSAQLHTTDSYRLRPTFR